MLEITIPKLGLTMEGARLLEWRCRPGDHVNRDDILAVMESEKITFELRAPEAGIVHPVALEGEEYPVGAVIGYIASSEEEYARLTEQQRPSSRNDAAIPAGDVGKPPPPSEGRVSRSYSPRLKASPLARAMAAAHGLELGAIRGSGPGGRIVREDILRALEQGSQETGGVAAASRGSRRKSASLLKEAAKIIPIQGSRRVILENMVLSLSQAAQLTLHTDVCAEALIHMRKRLAEEGLKVSYNAMLIKIAAMALRLHPGINASVEGNQIKIWKQVHIGLAVEAGDVLVVPVTRDPDLKRLRDIEHDIVELTHKAKKNQLSPDDLACGTFTISNLGFAGVDHFTPIIRPPESAILGVGRIIRKPAVRDDQVVVEARMGLSLTFDHRIIDGAPAARFLRTIEQMIEEPALMIA